MRTRHTNKRVEIEQDVTRVRYLRACHLHPSGDSTPESCAICLVGLAVREQVPSWVQCPQCRKVFHDTCMDKVVQTCDDKISCPCCKTSFPVDEYDTAWDASDAVDALNEEDDADFVLENDVGGRACDPKERRVLRSDKRARFMDTRVLRSGRNVACL